MKSWALLATMVLLVFVGVGQLAFYYDQLPENVASHFNAQGEADGYMSKSTHMVMMGALLIGTPAFMFLIAWGLRFMPNDLINMPHKEYWLADERRLESLAVVATGLYSISIATQLLLLYINQLVTWENLGQGGMSGPYPWVALGVYLGYTIGFCIWLSRRFQLPDDAVLKPTA